MSLTALNRSLPRRRTGILHKGPPDEAAAPRIRGFFTAAEELRVLHATRWRVTRFLPNLAFVPRPIPRGSRRRCLCLGGRVLHPHRNGERLCPSKSSSPEEQGSSALMSPMS